MKRIILGIGILFICVSFNADIQAQREGMKGRTMPEGHGSINGVVVNESTGNPVEYANIVIYRKRDSSMATGTVTDVNGTFLMEKVPYGFYTLVADFIGYEKTVKRGVLVVPRNPNVDVDEIQIKPAVLNLDEVEIKADKLAIEYKIDKKVVNVNQDLQSASGTAADVLENTPSVEVDIEGNVKLRGSSNFTVLINGRPGILQGSDALQQISASQIENIEVITNPSAKYDPEGTAGIINVIMKEKKDNGLTGVFNVGIGTRDKYKADFLLNYKVGDFSIYGGLDYRDDDYHMTRETDRETYSADTTYFYKSIGNRTMHRGGIKGNLGFDWYINEKTTLGLKGEYGTFEFGFKGDGKNEEWKNPADSTLYYLSRSNLTRPRDYYGINLNLSHDFDNNGHRLIGNIHWSDRWGDSEDESLEWLTDEYYNIKGDPLKSFRTTEDETSQDFRVQLDYTRPFSEVSKLEAGFQSNIDVENQNYFFEDYVLGVGWVENKEFSSIMDFKRNIHAAYVTYHDEFLGFGYLLGFRGEYTYRSITDEAINKTYKLDRLDYFPSIHISRQLKSDNQIFASYSRRINRPRGRNLDPFKIYIDKNNIRQGNPDLKPEYVDSYELGWMKRFGNSFLSVEGYYRLKKNAFTRVFKSEDQGVVLHTTENLNKEHSSGAEIMLNKKFGRKATLVLGGNVYYYKLQGEVESATVDKENVSWNSRMMATYKVFSSTRIQVMMGYRGGRKTAQGDYKGRLMSSLAIRHDFLKDRATATLQIRDLTAGMKRDFTASTDVLYEHTIMKRESPMVNLTLSYRLKNYKKEKVRPEGMEDMQEMDYGY